MESNGVEIKGFIARDKNSNLYLYTNMPKRDNNQWEIVKGDVCSILNLCFPEITWESEPVEVIAYIRKAK